MYDVISAFLDNEPFDPRELADALSAKEGRELLLDVMAMRALVQVPEPVVVSGATRRSVRPWLLAAAAVVLATCAGYGVGRISRAPSDAAAAAPAATAVFTFEPGVNWSETTQGGN